VLIGRSHPVAANFTGPEYDDNTSLHYCCFNGHVQALEMLLKVRPPHPSPLGPVLHAPHKHVPACLQAGADIHHVNKASAHEPVSPTILASRAST
jgi:ankyrin repeat protein